MCAECEKGEPMCWPATIGNTSSSFTYDCKYDHFSQVYSPQEQVVSKISNIRLSRWRLCCKNNYNVIPPPQTVAHDNINNNHTIAPPAQSVAIDSNDNWDNRDNNSIFTPPPWSVAHDNININNINNIKSNNNTIAPAQSVAHVESKNSTRQHCSHVGICDLVTAQSKTIGENFKIRKVLIWNWPKSPWTAKPISLVTFLVDSMSLKSVRVHYRRKSTLKGCTLVPTTFEIIIQSSSIPHVNLNAASPPPGAENILENILSFWRGWRVDLAVLCCNEA